MECLLWQMGVWLKVGDEVGRWAELGVDGVETESED